MAVIVKWVPADVIEKMRARLESAPQWVPQRSAKHMHTLGPRAVRRMKYAVMENVYTGSLQESIKDEYANGGLMVTIAPTVMRGKYDGGSILEAGAKWKIGIPNAPWGPIARWAAFRGLPAFPIVYKIRTQGVSPHPFLQRTLDDVTPDIDRTLDDILGDIAKYILSE